MHTHMDSQVKRLNLVTRDRPNKLGCKLNLSTLRTHEPILNKITVRIFRKSSLVNPLSIFVVLGTPNLDGYALSSVLDKQEPNSTPISIPKYTLPTFQK